MKILIIKSSLSLGGVDNLVMNQISYLHNQGHEIWVQYCDGVKEEKVEFYKENKCHLIKMPKFKDGFFKFIKKQTEVLKNERFDIIHSHICHFSYMVLIAAKIAGINGKIVCHSHYDDYYNGWPYLRFVMPIIQRKFKTSNAILVASSKKSGEALFGKNKFKLIYNGIDTSKFAFSQRIRESKRKELNIHEDQIALCNVAMFREQKNHEFLIDIFVEFLKKKPNAVLILVGDGPLKNKIKEKCEKLDIVSKVKFLGIRQDVDEILNAMDLCFFPTKFEGFSMGLIEYQCNGIPVVCSDVAPKEIKQVDNFIFKSLEDSAYDWAKTGIELIEDSIRKDNSKLIYEKKLDKNCFGEEIEKLYYEVMKNE